MEIAQQILFVAALAVTAYYISQRIRLITRTIRLGRPEDRTGNAAERWQTLLLVAFGQKKMFANPLVGLMHFVIYVGFLIINVEVLEIVLDGVLGTHRLFAPVIPVLYPFLINVFEVLALGVLVVCVVFLARRWVTRVSRLQASRHRELRGWPVEDATIILAAEILLMIAFLTWNAADSVLRDRGVGHYGELQGIVPDFLISQYLKSIFAGFGDTALVAYERIAWWVHILGIMAFAIFVTYSKHLHIALGFPNVYFSDLQPKGEMQNMPEITKEVQLALGLPVTINDVADTQPDDNGQQEVPTEIGRFGAKDVYDLKWINLLNAFSCTECGRCTAACPANITGKKLSPRKIMMDTRDRLETIQRGWQMHGNDYRDDKSLLGDYITAEELDACTTCQACINACPININPLDIILQLRRYRVMEESQAPASWNAMFSNIENNMAPWKFSPSDRFNWVEQINDSITK